ncbi:MAG: Gfo/Idh/MocA family oxidoreductase [Bacteroidota bacterium]|nr:Gfo/Idh/MocA family oxidoreductase [Bacteroidota bacterium]MDE2956439.1 Gfo/Idh/MocA family oxidoreductase [Bacteroidota bacterium]
MSRKISVLVAGCGHMGTSHARAYHAMDEFAIAGLVSRTPASRTRLSEELGGYPTFSSYEEALSVTRPEIVSINTYPDTHAAYVHLALDAGCHVFVEKPLANTVAEAQALVDKAKAADRKMVIGYILRVHPAWKQFIAIAQTLGKPLVMRMNLNQQSSGAQWQTHKHLMASMSPIVDCGVHYVDVMCQMTRSRPIAVSGIGARLSDEIAADQFNYGQLQVTFEDGSVGWYEAGWGPMMSETATFIKDVVGPAGSVSIADEVKGQTDDIEGHTQTGGLKVHHSSRGADGLFNRPDELLDMSDEPDHDELCRLEQEYLLKAIQDDLDLSDHMQDAVSSLQIVLAADQAAREQRTIRL